MKPSKKPISSYTDPAQVRQIMANAKRNQNSKDFWEAWRRLSELKNNDFDDLLEYEFYLTLAAYEKLLADKHGHRQPAVRIRQKLQRKGFIACLEDWALSSKRSDCFNSLVDSGQVELTGEYLVTQWPDRFSAKAVANAHAVLKSISKPK